ncbi:MAG: TonB-dependent receptor plug domain-containing protein [Owenweeksia sp.]
MAELRPSVFLILLLCGLQLHSQTDTLKLEAVDVVETRTRAFAVGSDLISIDSTQLKGRTGQSLSEVLSQEGLFFIKNYSPGNLATTSFRGANAQQTVITWNGFNINSPLNGQFDLSLFPVQSFDEVQVQPGASSALWGSGAIGGSVHLSHAPDFKPHWTAGIGVQAGSFETYSQNLEMSFGNEKYSGRLLLLNQTAENNFSFTNPITGEQQEQVNNELSTRGLLAENHLRLSSKDLLNFHIWFQETDRNIPPTLYETSRSSQKDDVLRVTSQWLHSLRKGDLKIRGAYFKEDQHFHNISADTLYHNAQQSVMAEAELNYRPFRHHHFDLGINHSTFLVDVDSYKSEEGIRQHRQSFFGGYRWDILSNLNFSAMMRQEVIDGNAAPFTFTTGMAWLILPQLELKGQYSKVYRTPTLNDLYWVPGGNRNLQSEYGYAQEISATWAQELARWNYSITVSAYNRNITNWIVWLPTAGVWSPQNLLEVHSRGFETRSKVQWRAGSWLLGLQLHSNYVLSTNERSSRAGDASLGRQLIYTPIYSGMGGFHVRYKRWTFRYQHRYTGYTYTTSDHSEYLEPYNIGSLYLGYDHSHKKVDGTIFMRIENLWDHDYQVVRNRPMPGIQYSIGLNVNFKLKQSR